MRLLKKGDQGPDVKKIQQYLGITADGDFGEQTKKAVERFQLHYDLRVDGIVGSSTLQMLIAHRGKVDEVDLDSNPKNTETNQGQFIENYYLPKGEYASKSYPLKYCYLHHTAGRENPYRVIDSWGKDDRGRVGTEFVLGGISHTSGSDKYDGIMLKAFPDDGYAYHLGKTGSGKMNKSSVGIEICSMGYLDNDNRTYVNSTCIDSQIIKLSEPFKGRIYWHKYSDKQIEQTHLWLKFIQERDQIDMKKGLQELIHKHGVTKAFDFHEDAYFGKIEGLLTHTNVRKDKTDCYPDPRLVDVIMSL